MLVDDITEEDEEVWVASPAPAPVPAPTLAPEPLLEEAAYVPPPVALEVENEMGWTHKYYFKQAQDTAYYHSLLTNMFEDYYLDLNASIKYYYVEYTHPLEASYWKTSVSIIVWNESKDGQEVEIVFEHIARQAKVSDSMEDVAQEAYIYYHGQRYEAMKEDLFRFLPHHDPMDGTWLIKDPQNSDPTLDATVRHVHAMQMENEELKEELREVHRS
jgi:hypothetical protein